MKLLRFLKGLFKKEKPHGVALTDVVLPPGDTDDLLPFHSKRCSSQKELTSIKKKYHGRRHRSKNKRRLSERYQR